MAGRAIQRATMMPSYTRSTDTVTIAGRPIELNRLRYEIQRLARYILQRVSQEMTTNMPQRVASPGYATADIITTAVTSQHPRRTVTIFTAHTSNQSAAPRNSFF